MIQLRSVAVGAGIPACDMAQAFTIHQRTVMAELRSWWYDPRLYVSGMRYYPGGFAPSLNQHRRRRHRLVSTSGAASRQIG